MRPSGDKVGVTAESVKLVSGMYSNCRADVSAEEFFSDANQNEPIPRTAIAARPAAALCSTKSRHELPHRGITIIRDFFERFHHQRPQRLGKIGAQRRGLCV